MTALREYGRVTDRLLRVRTGRQPYEVAVLVMSVVLGIVGTFVPEGISGAIDAEFNTFWSRTYWAALTLFATITLVGIHRRRVEGLLIERGGLTVMAALFGTYVYAAVATNGLAGIAASALPLSFVIASLARCWQIRDDLRLLTSYLRDHPGVTLP